MVSLPRIPSPRVAILGNSGSGKSTVARALAADGPRASLDLDLVAWERDQPGVARDDALACADVEAFCRAHDAWVIEGCYATLITASFVHRPTLVFLNPGVEACLANCRARPWEPHKYPSREAQDANLAMLLDWVPGYDTRTGQLSLDGHRACVAAYDGPVLELTEVVTLDEVVAALRARD